MSDPCRQLFPSRHYLTIHLTFTEDDFTQNFPGASRWWNRLLISAPLAITESNLQIAFCDYLVAVWLFRPEACSASCTRLEFFYNNFFSSALSVTLSAITAFQASVFHSDVFHSQARFVFYILFFWRETFCKCIFDLKRLYLKISSQPQFRYQIIGEKEWFLRFSQICAIWIII